MTYYLLSHPVNKCSYRITLQLPPLLPSSQFSSHILPCSVRFQSLITQKWSKTFDKLRPNETWLQNIITYESISCYKLVRIPLNNLIETRDTLLSLLQNNWKQALSVRNATYTLQCSAVQYGTVSLLGCFSAWHRVP